MTQFQFLDKQRFSLSTDTYLLSDDQYRQAIEATDVVEEMNDQWQTLLENADKQMSQWQLEVQSTIKNEVLGTLTHKLDIVLNDLNDLAMQNKKQLLHLCEQVTLNALPTIPDKHLLLAALDTSFDSLTNAQKVKVTLATAGFGTNTAELRDLIEQSFEHHQVAIGFDDSLADFQCVVESAYGRVDFNLLSDIRQQFNHIQTVAPNDNSA